MSHTPRIVGHLGIGEASAPDGLNPHFGLREHGWAGVVERFARPAIAHGFTDLLLHSPYGNKPGAYMEADALITAENARRDYVAKGFTAAWDPITTAGSEVIVYLGAFRDDPDWTRIRHDTSAVLRRLERSYKQALDANCSIALDMGSEEADDSIAYGFAELCEATGHAVYIEPHWMAGATHWRTYPAIATNSWWSKTANPDHPAHALYDWEWNDIQGSELIRIIDEPPEGETWATIGDWWPSVSRHIMSEGHSVCVGILPFLERGIPLRAES